MNSASKIKTKKGIYLLFVLLSLTFLSLIAQNIKVGYNESINNDFNPEEMPLTSAAPLYQVEWSRLYSSGSSSRNLELTSSEDIIISGYYSSTLMCVIKYDKSGNLQWSNTYTGRGGGIMTLDSSNNIYLVGYEEDSISGDRDYIIYKLNSAGTVLWTRTFDKNKYDYPAAIVTDGYNDVYIVGHTFLQANWENKDVQIVKYSSSGTLLWDRTLDFDDEDYGISITTDSSNNIYLCGSSRATTTNTDYIAAKYDRYGTLQWSKKWGGLYSESALDLIVDSSNNIFITGYEYVSGSHEEVTLLKLSNSGNVIWSRLWSGYGIDKGYCIDLDSSNNIYIGGATYEQSAGLYDVLLLTYDSGGNFRWWGRWGGGWHDTGDDIAIDSSNHVYIAGDYAISSYSDEMCLLKYNPAPSITINSPISNQSFSQSSPNYDVVISDTDLIQRFYTVNDGSQFSFSGSTGKINQAAWDGCPSGPVSLKFYGRDPAGSVYEEVLVRKDLIAPDFDISSPTQFQVFTDTAPNYVLSSGDSDIASIWYTLNEGPDFITDSLTGQIDQPTWNNLDNGTVVIEFFMIDDAGNVGSRTVEVYKYFEIPLININYPSMNEIFGLGAPEYDITVLSFWDIDQMWYSLNNGQNKTFSAQQGFFDQAAWDLLANGSVLINFYINNTLGHFGTTNMTVHKDIYLPYIYIYHPTPFEVYGNKAPNYNVSISSTILDSKWYNLNNGENITMTSDVGLTDQSLWNSCPNGTITLTFFANNTAGVVNFKEVLIQKDIRSPNITIISPQEGFFCGINTIDFSLLIEDPTLDYRWYSLNGGANYSFTGQSGTVDKQAWDTCGNGSVLITFYANNSLGNLGFAETSVHKDVYFPFISINSPSFGQICGDKAPIYNISISSTDIDTIWYSLNYGDNLTSASTYGRIDQSIWDLFGSEQIIITFYVNNSFGRINFLNTTIFKDTIRPNITVISPLINEVFGIGTIQYSITIDSQDTDSIWYTLNGGPKVFISELTGTIDPSFWDSLGNGTVLIAFFANNSLGNIGFTAFSVHRDIYFPFIEIIDPSSSQFCGILAPSFNFTVSTLALDTLWYTINDSTPNIIIASEGFIDQQVWNIFGEGNLHIKFWANNTYGQVNYMEVIVSKTTQVIERKAYAIIVGVSNYPGTSSDLNYCDDDAQEVRNMLINDYNFRPENIIYLQDSSATYSGITNAFNQIKSLINPNDIFYFYYSGHGGSDLITSIPYTRYIDSPHDYQNNYYNTWSISSTDAMYIRVHFSQFYLEYGYDFVYLGDAMSNYQDLTGYGSNFWSDWIPVLNDNRIYIRMDTDYDVNDWGFQIDQYQVLRAANPHFICPYDSIPSTPSNYYTDSLIDSQLDSINCHQKYVIVDACNSGGLISEIDGSNRYIMTACRGDEFSMEEPSLQNGIFTYYYLNSLQNANDQNNDGMISMEECFSFVYSGTRAYSNSYGPGIEYHPSSYDGISGPSVLYPAIGPIEITNIDNRVYYSFYLYGHGLLKELSMTVCSIHPGITYETIELKDLIISPTGFGYYSGYIDLDPGLISGGVQIYAEIEGNRLITLNRNGGDSDGDGLTDFFEISLGLNPYLNDTDNDMLLDGEELNIYLTDPMNDDTDNDGIIDGEEIHSYNTSPLNSDTDSDGLEDYTEIFVYNTNPLESDSDFDGLSDHEEIFIYFTNPLNNDTDQDLLLDGEEINLYLTNPFNNDTDTDGLLDGEEVYLHFTDPLLEDTDSDGLNDYDEIMFHLSDPNDSDTDSDTMPDGWEINMSLDPLTNDTALDPDNDMLINIDEYYAGTHPQNNDTDTEGLLDGEEVHLYFTNPLLIDTDSDGLSDYDEVMIHFTDPLQADSDSDGISDYDEIHTHGTDPLNEDTDSDTMPDGWEIDNLLDPFTNDTALDPDNDFLTNIEEFQHGTLANNNDTDSDGLLDGEEIFTHLTNPTIADTDSDGLLDGEEVNLYNTDPLDEDTDSDGLLDGAEVNVHNTDPLSGDTDSDTMPDKWEVDYSLNPLVNDTMLDPDSDGLINILEYQHNTNPQNSDTDGDGWSDGEEIEEDTDPLNPLDHPSPPPSPLGGIPGYYIIIIIISIVGWISLALARKKKFKLI